MHRTRISDLVMAAALAASSLLAGCRTPPPPSAPPPRLNTAADARVVSEVLQSINTFESALARGDVSPRLLTADPLGRRGSALVELWAVDSGGVRVEYEVQLNSGARGGSDYRITRLTPSGSTPAAPRISNLPAR